MEKQGAVLVEGPSRIGHYFRPVYGTSDNLLVIKDEGPVIRPDGQSHTWTLHYEPSQGGGNITVVLDESTIELKVSPEARKGNAVFDRFGFVSWHRGGHFVEIYVDDLTFTGQRHASLNDTP